MKHVPKSMLALLIVVPALIAVGLGVLILAFAPPDTVACALAKFAPLESLPDGTLVEPGISAQERAEIFELVAAARARIEKTFGAARAEPVVIFYKTTRVFGLLNLNTYGSTSFVAIRSCVMIGPKGRSISIVAHELMHAELCERVGYWHRLTEIPVWFDEGIAMQVDLRPRFELPRGETVDTTYVRQLKSPRRFFSPNEPLLVRNYAAAKVEVAHWLSEVGAQSVYQRFERIRKGEPFSAALAR